MSSPEALIKFLVDCSTNSLGEFELARLNEAANIEKQMLALMRQYLKTSSEADFARWMMEHREELLRTAASTQAEFTFTQGPQLLRQFRAGSSSK